MTRRKRFLLIAFGMASVGVGVIGILLPLVPTTPFLLLAAYLFARSSERLHKGLLGNRVIGGYLRRYSEGRCMSVRHKCATLGLLWTILALTAMLAVDTWWGRGGLGAVGIAVSIHILTLQTENGRSPARSPGSEARHRSRSR